MQQGSIRLPRPRWILLAAVLVFIAFAGLSWWSGRAAIRESRRLGGYCHAGQLGPAEPFAIDAMIDQVHFQDRPISDEYLVQFASRFRNVSVLSLHNCQLSEAGLSHLRRVPTLKSLILAKCDVTDAAGDILKDLPQLGELELKETKITDASVLKLGAMTKLNYLGLSHTSVGDAGIEVLGKLTNLHSLDLSHTGLTDEGLDQFPRLLPKLYFLNIDGTKVTAEGVARFRTAFKGRLVEPKRYTVTPGAAGAAPP